MKKLFLLLVIVSFCACNSGLEGEAKRQVYETMKTEANDPSFMEISNLDVAISNDSICILLFDMRDKDNTGRAFTHKYEYAYLISQYEGKKITVDMCEDIDKYEDLSILREAKDIYQNKKWEKGSPIDKMPNDEKKATIIYEIANAYACLKGIDVEYRNEKNKELKSYGEVEDW